MIDFKQYSKRFGFCEPQLSASVLPDTELIIVIPVFAEISLIPTLKSLQQNKKPNKSVEVILVFNASINAKDEALQLNRQAAEEVYLWELEQPKESLPFTLHCIEVNELPEKHAGVGLARKIGMDEALYRFGQIKNQKGIIACFDADSMVEENYFEALLKHFDSSPQSDACSIHFEHPLNGNVFPKDLYEGIALYELHLRYYKNGLAYAKLPFAIHTIGSSMAVRAIAYQKEGGMNKRKAGEDFYFLQKFISNQTCSNLTETTVIPSPRISKRVPFGTGRALMEMQEEGRDLGLSYAFAIFEVLKISFEKRSEWYQKTDEIHPLLASFVGLEEWKKKLAEIRKQSSTSAVFEKRLFQWFNAFTTLKFVHFLRDKHYENRSLIQESKSLLDKIGVKSESKKPSDLLRLFRKIDQGEI